MSVVSNTQQIGIYAGTFDPVHLGHIAFAEQAMRDCQLDKVIFLPEPAPRNKKNVTNITHRLDLIALAIASEPNFDLLRLAAPHFSVRRTLPELQQKFADADLTFLMGSDIAKSLEHWVDIQTLLQRASIAVGLRGNDNPAELTTIMEQLSHTHGVPIQYALISAPKANISSSGIRAGKDYRLHLPTAVSAYIEEHALYAPALPS